MKGSLYLDAIKSGVKKFEGRVNGPGVSAMNVHDLIEFKDRRVQRGIRCEIISKDIYSSFENMLKDKGVISMLPQLADRAKHLTSEQLISEGVKIYQNFPGSHRARQLGVAALGVKYLSDLV